MEKSYGIKKTALLLLLTLHCSIFVAFGQQGGWTWMNGSTIEYQPGVYGIQGVFDSAITPPASLFKTSITVTAAFEADTNMGCAPLVVQFINNSILGVHYLWNFGDGATSTLMNPSHIYTDTGKFTVTLKAINDTSQSGVYSNTCVKMNYIQIGIHANVSSRFTASTDFGCIPLKVDFTNNSRNATQYQWLLGNGHTDTVTNPHGIVYPDSGSFQVTLIAYNDNPSCPNSPDVTTLDINTGVCDLEFPNVFSPNGDQINDYFTFVSKGYSNCFLTIYNRWRQVLYASPLTETFWDGKINNTEAQVHDGVYYYLFTAIDFYGKPFVQKGFLTIIR